MFALAGNNEGQALLHGQCCPLSDYCSADYQLAEQSQLDLDYSDEESDYRTTNFPARHIYERLLPKVVERLSDIHYHRGCPYSGQGRPTTDQTFGDLHQCVCSLSLKFAVL